MARGLTDHTPSVADTALAAPRPSGAPAYVITLAPAIGDAKSDIAPSAQVIAWIVDPSCAIREPTPAWLTTYYQLTSAEARTAMLAVRSLSKPEIATALGVSENTVKTHLKTVYDKLGVRSQAGLVRAVMAGTPAGNSENTAGMSS
jgi:DNA-binding CsgD family transcriptional regulator